MSAQPCPAREPITAWAVQMPSGAISLFLERERAMHYAIAHHATLHLLVEAAGTQPIPQRAHPQPRMPQGELTPGGLMRA